MVTCHSSHVTRHTSHVTRHTSHDTHVLLQHQTDLELSEASKFSQYGRHFHFHLLRRRRRRRCCCFCCCYCTLPASTTISTILQNTICVKHACNNTHHSNLNTYTIASGGGTHSSSCNLRSITCQVAWLVAPRTKMLFTETIILCARVVMVWFGQIKL
jgi:hypothetical protein